MDRTILQQLVDTRTTTREMADCLNISQTNVRYWLNKHGLASRGRSGDFKCDCGQNDPAMFVKLSGGRVHHSLCKECHTKDTVERFRKHKAQAVEYKGGKCQKCGYNKCRAVLQFHHRDPKQKDPNWNSMRTKAFEVLKKELDKCDLLCANCHGEEHHLYDT